MVVVHKQKGSLIMNDDIEAQVVESGVMQTYRLNSWMKDLHPLIKSLKLGELSLAGAHNAGMDRKAEYSNSYITCQDDSFRYQLNNGVRALDIRLRWFSGYGDDNVNRGLVFDHSQTSGRTFANLLNDVDRFHEANPGEIIILAFHKLEPNQSRNPVPYAAIHAHFMRHYTHKMLPRSAAALTLEQIRVQYPGPRFIVAVPNEVCGGQRNNTYFWDKIRHEWAGSGVVSPERLFSFISGVMKAPPTSKVPWSLSATTYGIGGPGDIVDRLRDRFPVGGDWQRKSSIINFDWCARSNATMIRQCIESNVFKTDSLSIISPLPGTTGFNGASSVKET
jgi:1-phosphatidylinositol phosphodiesterase